MNCRECQQQFDAMLGGKLDGDARRVAEAHLRECARCASEWAQAKKLWALLGDAVAVQPSHGFADRVLRQLDAKTERETRSWFEWLHSWRWITATAVLVLAVGITTVAIYHEHRRDKQVKHFEELFNVVQNVDVETFASGTSLETEDAL